MDTKITQRFYSIICNRELGNDPDSVQKRVAIIEHLERVTGKQFSDTKEFHEVVSRFIVRAGEKQIPVNKLLRKKRIRLNLSQVQMAEQFKVDRRTIIRWESGKVPLAIKAIQWTHQCDAMNRENSAMKGESE